jgi:hypothetical protein
LYLVPIQLSLMEAVEPAIIEKLQKAGYTSVTKLPNNPNSGDWNLVMSDCKLSTAELIELKNAFFREQPDKSTTETNCLSKGAYILCAQQKAVHGQAVPLLTPRGTASAFTERLVFSANRNRLLSSNFVDGYYDDYFLVDAILREGSVAAAFGAQKLTVEHFDEQEDWVIFSLESGGLLPAWIPLCPSVRMPTAVSPTPTQYVCAVYAPVEQYLHAPAHTSLLRVTCEGSKRVASYQDELPPVPVEVTTVVEQSAADFSAYLAASLIDFKRIIVDQGLWGGACGAPYVDAVSKEAVAFHLYSVYESMTAEEVTAAAKQCRASDAGNLLPGHPSVKVGMIFCRLPNLVRFLRTRGVELNPGVPS